LGIPGAGFYGLDAQPTVSKHEKPGKMREAKETALSQREGSQFSVRKI